MILNGDWRSRLAGAVDPLFRSVGACTRSWPQQIPLGSVLVGLSRGTLAARRRFTAAAVAFAGENLIRVVAAVIVVLSGLGSNAYAIALIFGFLVVAIWPSARALRGRRPEQPMHAR